MENKITIGTKIISSGGLICTVVNIEVLMFDYEHKTLITYNHDSAYKQPHHEKVRLSTIETWLKHGLSRIVN